MRFLKVLVIAMGVLIVVATTVLVVLIARRIGGPVPTMTATQIATVLDEPAGTHIAGIAGVGDRLAVQLQGGGADRVVLLDPHSGEVVGRITVHSR